MANVDMTVGSGKQCPATGMGASCLLTKNVKWADVLTAKGSALAAGDLVQLFDIPIATWVDTGIIHNVVVPTTTMTVLTLHLGYTSDDDHWQASYDGMTITSVGTALDTPVFFSSADTVDIDLDTITTTLVNGEVNVNVIMRPLYAGILASNK